MNRPDDPRRKRPARAAFVAVAAVALVASLPATAQEDTEADAAPVFPEASARLIDPQGEAALPVSLAGSSPLVSLPVIAGRLGLELRVGPLGESHTLTLADRTVRLGPESAMAVVTRRDGEEEILALSRPPVGAADGLRVPLDLLEQTVGDALGMDFRWDPVDRALYVGPRQVRDLDAQLVQVHQGLVTTVEATFSQTPRYRVDRQPSAIEIRLVGDRVSWLPFTSEDDPLVAAVDIWPDRFRVELAPNAAAAEPRLLENPPRLIVEVFRRRATSDDEPDAIDGEPADEEPVSRARAGVRTIVIDPGHGGAETGAIKNGLVEKDLTLWFARVLRRRLENRLPVRVLLTREDDVDVPLESRAAFANQNKADLFVSLHLNSWFGGGVRGAETYFLSRQASDEAASRAAAAENLQGAGTGGGAESDLQLILWDLAQSYHLAESQRFAKIVQEELNETLGIPDRGVKQAPFRVLVGANMPAVVVELGFISNPEEAARLQDPDYRGELINALVRAVARFRNQLQADGDEPAENLP